MGDTKGVWDLFKLVLSKTAHCTTIHCTGVAFKGGSGRWSYGFGGFPSSKNCHSHTLMAMIIDDNCHFGHAVKEYDGHGHTFTNLNLCVFPL